MMEARLRLKRITSSKGCVWELRQSTVCRGGEQAAAGCLQLAGEPPSLSRLTLNV